MIITLEDVITHNDNKKPLLLLRAWPWKYTIKLCLEIACNQDMKL